MHQASVKDIAVYFQRALATGLCHNADVEFWAAEMIARCAGDVPNWMRELSVDLSAKAVAGTVPEEYRRVAYLFDDHHEGIGPGWFAEEELQKEMASFFEQFRAYEPQLPTSPQTRSL